MSSSYIDSDITLWSSADVVFDDFLRHVHPLIFPGRDIPIFVGPTLVFIVLVVAVHIDASSWVCTGFSIRLGRRVGLGASVSLCESEQILVRGLQLNVSHYVRVKGD